MKKLMLIATIAIVLCSSATEIKLVDIFTPAARPQLTNGQWKATCEIAKFPSRVGSWTEFGKVLELCKDNETVRAEFDEMFAKSGDNLYFIRDNTMFPKAFTAKMESWKKSGAPKHAAAYLKAGKIYPLTFTEMLGMYEEVNVREFKAAAIPFGEVCVRRYLFKSGTGLATHKDEAGNVFNPIKQPMDELIAALDAPYLNGLNDWFKKYTDGKYVVDTSKLPTTTEVDAIINAIIDGKVEFNAKRNVLEKTLGITEFNKLIEKFNGTQVK